MLVAQALIGRRDLGHSRHSENKVGGCGPSPSPEGEAQVGGCVPDSWGGPYSWGPERHKVSTFPWGPFRLKRGVLVGPVPLG